VAVAGIVALAGGSVIVASRCRAEPVGHFAAYPNFSLHERRDVLTFAKGSVTLQTCCGDEPMGSYQRTKGGNWYWSYSSKRGTNTPIIKGFVVEPGAMGLTLIGKENSTNTHSLRRRLFVRLPI
jgi:hypothetical protein